MTSFLDALENGFHRLLFGLIIIVAASIGIITVLIPLNLLLIKMQWGSLWWLNEGVEYCLYVGVFLGAPWVLQQGAHVRVDIVLAALPQSGAIQVERLVSCIGAAICAVLCFYGARATLIEFQDGTLPDKDLRIANWLMLAVLTASFLLLALEFLFRLRRAREVIEESKSTPVKASF